MDLHGYIAKDKEMKEEKEETEKALIGDKLNKEETMKKLDQKIAIAKSEIEKHKGTLYDKQANQKFLLTLSDETFTKERSAKRSHNLFNVRQKWIQTHKADPFLDYDILYRDDEEIHENKRMQFAYLQKFNSGGPEARRKVQHEWAQWHS